MTTSRISGFYNMTLENRRVKLADAAGQTPENLSAWTAGGLSAEAADHMIENVIGLKKGAEKEFIIVDAGMNDLIRPSFYGSYHHIQPVVKKRRKSILADVVGPICESGDFLAKDRDIAGVKQGEYLAVMSAGAYSFTMSSTYNSRPRAAEVMIKGKEFALVRAPETDQDLVRGETIPAFI